MKCTNRVCPYCEETVNGGDFDDVTAACCGEVHNQECGVAGIVCQECFEAAEEKAATHPARVAKLAADQYSLLATIRDSIDGLIDIDEPDSEGNPRPNKWMRMAREIDEALDAYEAFTGKKKVAA